VNQLEAAIAPPEDYADDDSSNDSTIKTRKSVRTMKSFKSAKTAASNKSAQTKKSYATSNTRRSAATQFTKRSASTNKSYSSRASTHKSSRQGRSAESSEPSVLTSRFSCNHKLNRPHHDDASVRADDIIERMKRVFNTPDQDVVGDDDDDSVDSIPHTISSGYYTTINVWAKSKNRDDPDAAAKAQGVLDRMEQLLKDTKKKKRINRGALYGT